MVKKLRFYFALAKAFLARNKKWFSYSLIFVLIGVFLIRIVLPHLYENAVRLFKEFQKPSFVEGVVGVPVYPNPVFDATETQKDISSLVYRGLTKVNSKGELDLDLAERFEQRNDREYVFYLKKDIYWHDGKKFTADDVVYTIETAKNPQFKSNISTNFQGVKSEKIDDYTVKFILDESFAPFPYATTVGIIPKHIELKNFKPIGTGSFRVKSISDKKIVLTNEKLNIVFKFYNSIQNAKTALKLGEIHSLGGISPQEAKEIEMFGGKNIYSKPFSFRQVVVYFNLNNKYLKEKDFRQALAFLIDKNTILKTIGSSNAKVSTSQLPLINWVVDQPEQYTKDLKKAEENLKEAGFKFENGVWKDKDGEATLTITSADDPELNTVVNLLQNFWTAYGIKTKPNLVDTEALRNNVLPNRDFDVLVDFQRIPPDPDQYVLWHTTQTNNFNITGVKSPKLDKILEDARLIGDQSKRKEKYQLFTRLLLDELPAIFLYYPEYYWVVSKKVEGIDFSDFAAPVDRFNSFNNWEIRRKFF